MVPGTSRGDAESFLLQHGRSPGQCVAWWPSVYDSTIGLGIGKGGGHACTVGTGCIGLACVVGTGCSGGVGVENLLQSGWT